MQDHHFNLLVLSTERDESYFRHVVEKLSNRGHHVSFVQSVVAAEDCVQSHELHIIIADDSHPSVSFLKDVDELAFDSSERPLLGMVTEQDSPPDLSFVDVVLPPVPVSFLERELSTHHRYRQHITKLREHRNEIELLKNAIVHNVSHELKTPLLQVKAAVGLIAEDAGDDSLTQMAVTSTARLETVIKNITLLADSMRGNLGPILFQESVDQAMRNLRRSWEHKNDIQRIQLDVDSHLPPILADKQGMGIVMQQLMDNALKFSKESKTPVEVMAKQCDDTIAVTVRDYGIGIAEDKLKQIFDTFFQIDSSSTRRYGGTGVGLAIVRLILEKHSVDIRVESELDKGSTFSFNLPFGNI